MATSPMNTQVLEGLRAFQIGFQTARQKRESNRQDQLNQRLLQFQQRLNPLLIQAQQLQNEALAEKPGLISARAFEKQSEAALQTARAQTRTLTAADIAELTDEDFREFDVITRAQVRRAKRTGGSVEIPLSVGQAVTSATARLGATQAQIKARAEVTQAWTEFLRARAASEPQKASAALARLELELQRTDLAFQQIFAPIVTTIIETFTEGGGVKRTRTQQRVPLVPQPQTAPQAQFGGQSEGGIQTGPVDLRQLSPGAGAAGTTPDQQQVGIALEVASRLLQEGRSLTEVISLLKAERAISEAVKKQVILQLIIQQGQGNLRRGR